MAADSNHTAYKAQKNTIQGPVRGIRDRQLEGEKESEGRVAGK